MTQTRKQHDNDKKFSVSFQRHKTTSRRPRPSGLARSVRRPRVTYRREDAQTSTRRRARARAARAAPRRRNDAADRINRRSRHFAFKNVTVFFLFFSFSSSLFSSTEQRTVDTRAPGERTGHAHERKRTKRTHKRSTSAKTTDHKNKNVHRNEQVHGQKRNAPQTKRHADRAEAQCRR